MRCFEPRDEELTPQSLLDLARIGALEKQLDRFAEIGGRLLHGVALARHIELWTEGDPLVRFALQDRGEGRCRHGGHSGDGARPA